MKAIRKILSFILASVMLCSVQNFVLAEGVSTTDLVDFVVEVEGDRAPRIMQITDTQIIESEQARTDGRLGQTQREKWSATKKEENCYAAVRQVVEEFNPDLIILTGDFVYGEFDDSGAAFLDQIDFFDSLEVPWAPIFGNHENESTKGADWQCEQFEKSEYCLFKQRTLTGNGNYTVGISQGGELKRVFVMLDSNGCAAASEETMANGHSRKNVGFGDDQIEWYTAQLQAIKQASPETKISAAFHIQLNAFQEAMDNYSDYFQDTDETTKQINLDLDKYGINGDYGYIGRNTKSVWDTDNKIFDGLKELGVDSIFNGHEHCNNGSILYDGVRLVYGLKSSTYDRYNYITETGSVAESGVMPYIGGTAITLNENDGSIESIYNMLTKGVYVDVTAKGTYNEENETFVFDNVNASIKKNQNVALVNGKKVNLFAKAAYITDSEGEKRFYAPKELVDIVDEILTLKEEKIQIFVDYNTGAVTAKGFTGTSSTPVSVVVTKPGKQLNDKLEKGDIAYIDHVFTDVYGQYTLTFNSEILEGKYIFNSNYYLNTTNDVEEKEFSFVNNIPSMTVTSEDKKVKRMLELTSGDVLDVTIKGFDFDDDFVGAIVVAQYCDEVLVNVDYIPALGGSTLAGDMLTGKATVLSGIDKIKVMYWQADTITPLIGSYVIE